MTYLVRAIWVIDPNVVVIAAWNRSIWIIGQWIAISTAEIKERCIIFNLCRVVREVASWIGHNILSDVNIMPIWHCRILYGHLVGVCLRWRNFKGNRSYGFL